MRVFIISSVIPYFPGPGSQTREYCLARELSRRHEITYLLPLRNEQERARAEALSAFCTVRLVKPTTPSKGRLRWWRGLYNMLKRWMPVDWFISKVIAPTKRVQGLFDILPKMRIELQSVNWYYFDLLQIERSHLAYALHGINIPTAKILSWHDLHSVIERRKYHAAKGTERVEAWIEWLRTVRYENKVARQVDKSIVMSNTDATRLHQLYPYADISVVPNGVDGAYFHNPLPDKTDSATLVFTGSMDYDPNVQGILFFCQQVLPLIQQEYPDVRLFIVGKRPKVVVKQLADKHPDTVIVTGTVNDVRPYLRRATISVVPLLNGSGTRLKILEAMAMQKAVVSTSVGCEGLEVTHGQDILIADTPNAFAKATLWLLRDSTVRQRIASQSYKLVQKWYNWRLIANRQEEVWQSVAERGECQKVLGATAL